MDKKFVRKYNALLEKQWDYAEKFINEYKNKNEGAFLFVSVILRLAARISSQYNVSKETFIQTAKNNFDLEKPSKNITQTNTFLN